MRKWIVMLIICLSVLITACSGEDGGEEKNSNNKETVLTVASNYGGTDPAAESLEEILKDFEEKHENVKIENDSGGSSAAFTTKMQTSWSAGDNADLTFFFSDQKGDFITNSGNVVSMDELFKDEPELEEGYNPVVLDQVREGQGGELYSLPINGYYEGLIVNKSFFEEEDLELPETWEQFETAIKTFAETDIIPLAAGLTSNPYLIDNFILATGGIEGHSEAYSDSYNEGLELVKKSYEMDAYAADALTIDNNQGQDYFKSGQAAMLIEGSWALGGLPDEIANETTVLPMPVAPDGELNYGDVISGFSSGWYLAKDSYEDENKKEILLELLKHLTSEESIKKISEAQGSVPAADIELDGLNPAQEDGMAMVNNADNLVLAADGSISSAAFTYLRDHLPQIVTGESKIEDVLNEMEKLDK